MIHEVCTLLLASCPHLPLTYYDRNEWMTVRQQGRDVVALRGSVVLPISSNNESQWHTAMGRLGEDGRSLHITSGFRSVGTVYDNCTIRWDVNTTWTTLPPKKEEREEYSYEEQFPFEEDDDADDKQFPFTDEYDDGDRVFLWSQFTRFTEERMKAVTSLMMDLWQDMHRMREEF